MTAVWWEGPLVGFDLEVADEHLPCLQPMTVPPFEPCPNPADPDHPDQLCDDHAGRRRS